MLLKVHIKSKKFITDGIDISVLRKLNFDIENGDFVCVIGPSGCGKSTILKIIMGLDNDYEGEIYYKGNLYSGINDKISIVFQDSRLLPWETVYGNVEFALVSKSQKQRQLAKSFIDEVIELVGLNSFKNAWPKELSGGMTQKVALARAFVNTPELLLLDEPFGALDDFTRKKLQEEFKKILSVKRTSVLMVTHNIDEAIFLSNRIVVLSDKPAGVIEEFIVKDSILPDDKISLKERISDALKFNNHDRSDDNN